jgi:hypothetical protein
MVDAHIESAMSGLLLRKVIPEVRAPLPRPLKAAQADGQDDFFARTADATP